MIIQLLASLPCPSEWRAGANRIRSSYCRWCCKCSQCCCLWGACTNVPASTWPGPEVPCGLGSVCLGRHAEHASSRASPQLLSACMQCLLLRLRQEGCLRVRGVAAGLARELGVHLQCFGRAREARIAAGAQMRPACRAILPRARRGGRYSAHTARETDPLIILTPPQGASATRAEPARRLRARDDAAHLQAASGQQTRRMRSGSRWQVYSTSIRKARPAPHAPVAPGGRAGRGCAMAPA